MKGKRNLLLRMISSTLVLVVIISMMCLSAFTSVAESVTTKVDRSYDIALVFDNSGSMYDNKAAWCRAKYAMEIFASMLDYEAGDKLTIYPMWEITKDGKTKSQGAGTYDPFQIKSKSDIDLISNIYTTNPNRTPFAAVTDAFNGIKNSGATDKWVIILTDGGFTQLARGEEIGKNGEDVEMSSKDLKKRLEGLANSDVKIQYLGFGTAKKLESNPDIGLYAKNSSETSLKDDLVEICNAIFQRAELKNRLKDNKLELDMSMSSLIVFAQGAGAEITSIVDGNNSEVTKVMDSGQRKYSTISAYGREDVAKVDKTLAGQVVRFSACPQGTYTLNYSGADKIQIFYEPDVDISVTMADEAGNVVDPSKAELLAGDYTITSKIVDSVTGEDLTKSELMGNISLSTFVKNGTDDFVEYKNGSTITFTEDNETDVYIEGRYLEDYTITTKDSKSAFPVDWKILPPSAKFDVKANVLQSQSWYKISDHNDWKPIKVSMTLDGATLTDEQLSNVGLDLEFSALGESDGQKLTYYCEPISGESAYNVYVGYNEAGEYVEPPKGLYNFKANATYTDEVGRSIPASDSVTFQIQRYDKFWQWLFWILILLAVIAVLWFILSRKAWPHKIYCITQEAHRQSKKTIKPGKKMTLIPINSAVRVSAEKNSCLLHKFSRSKASIKVVFSSASPMVDSFSINGRTYYRSSEFKASGEVYSDSIYGATSFTVNFNNGMPSKSGTIQINDRNIY